MRRRVLVTETLVREIIVTVGDPETRRQAAQTTGDRAKELSTYADEWDWKVTGSRKVAVTLEEDR